MNERLLEAKKKAEKFKEYLQSDSKKRVKKFAQELVTHKDNVDFVGIIEDALTLYDFENWKNESNPAEVLVIKKTPEDIAIENLLAFFKCFCGGTLEINGAESDGQKVTLHFGCMDCETKWKTSFHFEEE